jgi:hypothetical protein
LSTAIVTTKYTKHTKGFQSAANHEPHEWISNPQSAIGIWNSGTQERFFVCNSSDHPTLISTGYFMNHFDPTLDLIRVNHKKSALIRVEFFFVSFAPR